MLELGGVQKPAGTTYIGCRKVFLLISEKVGIGVFISNLRKVEKLVGLALSRSNQVFWRASFTLQKLVEQLGNSLWSMPESLKFLIIVFKK
jgi:hypothetical protein